MSRITRPLRRGAWLASALLVALALPAAAHPGFDPDELPANEATEVEFVIPHGCGTEAVSGGPASPTVEVALGLPEVVTAVDVPPQVGWQVEVEQEDGRDAVIVFTEDGGATTDPIVYRFTLTVTGEPDDAVYLPVNQTCEDGSYRWIGTPDEPAEHPAAAVTVIEGSSSPAPTAAPPGAAPTATPTPTSSPTVAPTVAPTPAGTDDGGTPGGLVAAIAVALVLLLGGVGILAKRRGAGA